DHRVNEVLVGIYGGRENLRTSKGPTLVRSSKGNLSAGFLSLRTIPLVGFQLLAQADGHGREANWKDADGRSAGSQPISTGLGTVGVGFDTFFKNPNRRHQLVLEVRGALGRFPSLPVDASPEITDQSLGLKMNEVQLAGGGLWYRWTLGPWGLGAFGSMMVQSASRKDTNDATLDEWGGFLAFDPLKYVTVQVGGRSRIFSMARCSKDQLRCVTEGTAKTSMSQSMGFLGLGYVMR
ncbi:MAG: hypothetical protein NTV34_20440, partial [Proteobacteria bacterium]|nr:hypothetical protein [Pseudomonadota bacterium]